MSTNQVAQQEGFPLPVVITSVERPVSLDLRYLYGNEAHNEESDAQAAVHEEIVPPPEGCDDVVHF